MRALQFGVSSLHHCRRPVALVVFLDSALGYIMSSVGMSQVRPQLLSRGVWRHSQPPITTACTHLDVGAQAELRF